MNFPFSITLDKPSNWQINAKESLGPKHSDDKPDDKPIDRKNASPVVEVKATRVGASTYQVPSEVSSFRATNLSLRWLVRFARERSGRTVAIKLANEFIDSSNGLGNAIRKKEETHRMAEANKAFAHFRR